jgi:putative exporter of polyketide antibiotics
MTADARGAALRQPSIPLRRRLYGFGSIYGKTIRDSRLAFLIAAGLLGGIALVIPAAIGTVFPTPAARLEVNNLIASIPASMVNLFGNATLLGPKLGTLGGYMSWKYGALFGLGTALWSILALS